MGEEHSPSDCTKFDSVNCKANEKRQLVLTRFGSTHKSIT